MWDVFISHASEDKAAVARPLAERLKKSGLTVWFDEHALTLGDSLREKIDEGLSQSRYGILILSTNFFAKKWPKRELEGLLTREDAEGKVILPVRHQISEEEVARVFPLIAGRVAVSTTDGLDAVAEAILAVARPETELPPPRLEDLFSRDPGISLSAAERLPVDQSADIVDVVSKLKGLNPVTILAARTYLARAPERSAPLMAAVVLNADRDWHSAALVPECFEPAHRPFCEDQLAKAAKDSEEPDVARKTIESLGFLGASGWSWALNERLRASSEYFYEKLEFYVVLAVARMFQLHRDDRSEYQAYIYELRNQFHTLEKTIRLLADRGWRSITFPSLMDILALCPTDRADLFLEKWLNSDHPDLRRLAARTLGQMRLRRNVPHLLDQLADDDSRHEVMMALGNIGGPEAVHALREIIVRDGVAGTAGMALSAASETVEEPAELESIASLLLDAEVSEECFVYRAMGINGDPRFADRVRSALIHRNATVRAHAALALARITGSTEIKRLREMYREAGAPMERCLIATALLVAGQPEADGALLDGLRSNLAMESYLYKRMTCDDFVTVLSASSSERARRLANAWRRVYATRPDY
jgi:TIR domain-containing protein/HEAT repeat protein